ncbi:MAG: hypothetical protein ACO22O_16155 [bacterium]
MAYPTVSAPYGLRPINLIGGQVFAGSTRLIPIASGSGTSIFYGDAVVVNSTGTITKVAATNSSFSTVGVFLGCQYTNPTTKQLLQTQYFPGGTVADDIKAVVLDDPDALMKVAVVSTGTTIGYLTQAAVGQNVAYVPNAASGSTTTGDSAAAVLATADTETALPFKIVDVVPETAIAGYPGSYTEVIVKFNFGVHQYYNAGGSQVSA